jgi:hypothetical protein
MFRSMTRNERSKVGTRTTSGPTARSANLTANEFSRSNINIGQAQNAAGTNLRLVSPTGVRPKAIGISIGVDIHGKQFVGIDHIRQPQVL